MNPRTETIPAAPLFRRPRPWAVVGTVVGLAVLVTLGTWQVERLGWKSELIATLEARRAAPPVAFADVLGDPVAHEFRRAVVTGSFAPDTSLLLANRTRNGQVGLHIVSALQRDDGGVVLVDRGWVPADWPDLGAPLVATEQTVEGFVRLFPVRGRFTPDNDAADNVWFYLDGVAMARAAGVAAVAPVYLTAVPGPDPDRLPTGQPPGITLRNNHLVYALTWYGLALALVGVFVFYHLGRRTAP